MEKSLEFNSQLCTTREQSEKLLSLGLKKETADMSYISMVVNHKVEYRLDCSTPKSIDIPAWSLHRLMEIAMKGDKLGCITHNIHQNNVATYYELVISTIEHLIKIDEFNKDYLEDKK